MFSLSPLATSCRVIEQVRTNAASNTSLFQNNEAATRAALIDPILRALGWDTTNVRMVEPERTVTIKQKLDYLLKDAAGNICSILEAKKLGESLDKIGHVGAVIGYAFSLKPKSFFITDGLNWHYYSPAHSSYQPVETIHLNETSPTEAALRLIQWLDAAQSGYGIEQFNADFPVLQAPERPLPTPFPNKLDEPNPKLKKQLTSTLEFTELSHPHLLSLQPDRKPKQLRLPDGSTHQIKSWKDILVKSCQFVLEIQPALQLPLPDKSGKKTALLRRDPPAQGLSFAAVSYKGKPLYIYTNYSAAGCVANSIHVLQLIAKTKQLTTAAIAF